MVVDARLASVEKDISTIVDKRGGGDVGLKVTNFKAEMERSHHLDAGTMDALCYKLMNHTHLSTNWYERYRAGEDVTEMFKHASEELVANGMRSLRLRGKLRPEVMEILNGVSKVVIASRLVEDGMGNVENGGVAQNKVTVIKWGSDYKNKEYAQPTQSTETEHKSNYKLVDQLRPLLKYSSMGDDCVPVVAMWMLAAANNIKDPGELEDLRQLILADVAKIRETKEEGLIGSGRWIDEKYIALVLNGRLGETQSRKTFSLVHAKINGGDRSNSIVQKLDEICSSTPEGVDGKNHGSFTVSEFGTAEVVIEGRPITSIQLSSSIEGWVGSLDPKAEVAGVVGGPRGTKLVGEAHDVASYHQAMIVDFGRGMVTILDPQIGAMVGIRRADFDKMLNDRRITVGLSMDITHIK